MSRTIEHIKGLEDRYISGTIGGGKRAAETNKARYGDNFYSVLGRKGGLKTGSKGFASEVRGADGLTGRERAAIAGAKGGMLSRRKKRNCLTTDCDKGAWKHGYCHDHFIEVYREEHHE